MRKGLLASTLVIAVLASSLSASAQTLQPALAGLAFLLGSWTGGEGQVMDMGGTSTGSSVFELEAGGGVLLRRDHTKLFDKAGKHAGGFDQLMTIYAEQGDIHADYFDGTHVIHYRSATILPGRSVTFDAPASGGPGFRLAYALNNAGTLSVSFAMAPPGQTAFRPIAAGTLQKGQ